MTRREARKREARQAYDRARPVVSFRVPPELHVQLRALAKARGVKPGKVARELLGVALADASRAA